MNLLTFRVGDELYGVELDAVESVVRCVDRAGIREEDGVRLDLAAEWGAEPSEGGGAELRLRTGGGTVRVAVDGLGEVTRAPRSRLLPLPRLFTSELLRGVVPVNDRLVLVLDVKVLMRLADPATVRQSRGD